MQKCTGYSILKSRRLFHIKVFNYDKINSLCDNEIYDEVINCNDTQISYNNFISKLNNYITMAASEHMIEQI